MYSIYFAFYKISMKNMEMNINKDKSLYTQKCHLDLHFTYMYRYVLDNEGSMQ